MLKLFKIYYQSLLKYKVRFISFSLVLVVAGIAESIQPYFYKLFIEAIPGGDYSLLFKILMFYFGVRIASMLLGTLTYFLADLALFSAARDVRLKIFKKLQDLDFAFHLSRSTGSLISAMRRGDTAFFDLFYSVNVELAFIIVQFVVMLVIFTSVRWEITALMILSFLINLVLAQFLVKYNIRKRREFNDVDDSLSGLIVDNLINYETVKIFAREKWEFNRLNRKFKDWMKKIWGFSNSFRAIDILVGTTGNISLFVILLVALNSTREQNFTVGEFVLILGFLTAFYPKFFELIFRFRTIAQKYTDLQKYLAILESPILVKDPVKPIAQSIIKNIKGKIEFKDVSFSYPQGKKNALKNFNLTIEPGESVAFAGESGGGKTTVIKLLLRFFDIDKGEILIDGINIKKFTKAQLRFLMGVVPQESVLFNDTLRFNLTYGKHRASQREIRKAIRIANLEKTIKNMTEGYKTLVGERGVKLSGGQKQRLAIARAILSDPKIIIFDEATSQLDSLAEKRIQKAFWQAAKGRSTLIIAHRLSTITKADKIIVMAAGKIKEVGTHRELLQKEKGVYQKLWGIQVRE